MHDNVLHSFDFWLKFMPSAFIYMKSAIYNIYNNYASYCFLLYLLFGIGVWSLKTNCPTWTISLWWCALYWINTPFVSLFHLILAPILLLLLFKIALNQVSKCYIKYIAYMYTLIGILSSDLITTSDLIKIYWYCLTADRQYISISNNYALIRMNWSYLV